MNAKWGSEKYKGELKHLYVHLVRAVGKNRRTKVLAYNLGKNLVIYLVQGPLRGYMLKNKQI